MAPNAGNAYLRCLRVKPVREKMEAQFLRFHFSCSLLLQQADIVVRFPQHMVRQQRQDDTADLALLDSLRPCGHEVPEFDGLLQRLPGQSLVMGVPAGLLKSAIVLRKPVRGR